MQHTITKLRQYATRVLCRQKNDALHDARKQEPPAPPKEVDISNLKGQVIHSWTFLTFTPPDNNNKCASTPKNGKDFYGYAFKTLLSTTWRLPLGLLG